MSHKVSLFELALPFTYLYPHPGDPVLLRSWFVPGPYQPRTWFGTGLGCFPRHGSEQFPLMLRISVFLIRCK